MMTKVVHADDIGSGLEISGGKLNAAATMATDAEVAAQIAAADAAEDMAEAQAKLHTDYIMRAHQHLTTASLIQVDGLKVRILPDASNSATTDRILLMGGGEGTHAGADGHFVLTPPAAGSVVKGLGIADITVDVNGFITFPVHGTLYAKIPAAGSTAGAATEWYMAAYNASNYTVPEDYVLILQQNINVYPGNMFQLYDGTKLFQGYNYTNTGWISLTPYLVAGMSNYGSGFADVRFRRLNNRVYLEGLLNTSSTGYVGGLANLPVGFRPSKQHVFSAAVHNGVARIDVGPTGLAQIITNSGGQPWVSLDGIHYDLA